jgi:hypothetical protein
LYFLLNVGFAMLVGVGYASGAFPNPRLLHLILLFALCSHFVVDLDGLNGRYALLALFMLIYFISYGVGDVSNLFAGGDVGASSSGALGASLLSKTESVVLVGGIMLVLGYRLAVLMQQQSSPNLPAKDWPKGTILFVGPILWGVGTIATYRWNVYVVTDTTNEAFRKGIASLSPAVVTLYMLAQMCQPLGILLLAYAYRVFRGKYLLPGIIVVVAVQLFIGFVVDVKGLAMLGLILVTVTALLVDGRLPKVWVAVGVVFVILVFPFFQAYRATIHGGYSLARTTVVENFGKVLSLTIAAKDRVNSGRDRAQTFLERGSLKGSVEIIVEKTGHDVDFQHGYTLSPILATFMPRVIWSDKRTVPTGQMVNKTFHITDSDDIWISPSNLGELYWNFGWAGVVVGMGVIGLICGWVGASFNLAEFTTVTRVLVTVLTVKWLIVGFEGAIADIYMVWLRSLAGIGLLHLLFARVPAANRLRGRGTPELPAAAVHHSEGGQPFPNLLT